MLKTIKGFYYSKRRTKMKAKYQFGSPIIGVYAYNEYMVVATKLDIYVTMDGINYERVKQV